MKQGIALPISFLSAIVFFERFAYYAFRSVLALMMVQLFMMDTPSTYKVYGFFMAMVYILPLFCSFITEFLIGRRASICLGLLLAGAGMLAITLIGTPPGLFAALALVAVGTAFFRPGFYAMFSEVLFYKTENETHAAFTGVYFFINMAAFIAPLLAGVYGFFGLSIYYPTMYVAAGALFIAFCLGIALFFVTDKGKRMPLTSAGDTSRMNIGFVFIAIALCLVFYFVSEVAAASPVLFMLKEKGLSVPASYLYAINPVVAIFASFILLVVLLVTKVKTSVKLIVSYGFALAGILCFTLPLSLLSVVAGFSFLALSESIFSPLVLTFIGRLSPPRVTAIFYGIYTLFLFLPNLAAGYLQGRGIYAAAILVLIPLILMIVFSKPIDAAARS